MEWLTKDWKTLLPIPLAVTLLVFTAAVAGAIIGTERQRKEKPAGLRTLILVCMGAAAFTLVSFAFTTATGDSGRVSAQIVTGIGFLGAGVIMRGRGTISGTTTAATIWIAAAIGMTAGAGYVSAALGLSVLVRLVLTGISAYEVHLIGGLRCVLAVLEYDPAHGKTRVHLERILADYPGLTFQAEWSQVDQERDRLTLHLHLPQLHLRELLADMALLPEVKSIQEETADPKLGKKK
jgi:putative Mg2+ transporter-C (MgtC) family protein